MTQNEERRTGKSGKFPEITELAGGGSWNLNPESLTPESTVLTTTLPRSINTLFISQHWAYPFLVLVHLDIAHNRPGIDLAV